MLVYMMFNVVSTYSSLSMVSTTTVLCISLSFTFTLSPKGSGSPSLSIYFSMITSISLSELLWYQKLCWHFRRLLIQYGHHSFHSPPPVYTVSYVPSIRLVDMLPLKCVVFYPHPPCPVVSNHGSLGMWLRPWRGVVTDCRTTAICRFRARREWPTSMA